MPHHNIDVLRAMTPDQLDAYIIHCESRAFSHACNTYRERLQEGLLGMASGLRDGEKLRLPLPITSYTRMEDPFEMPSWVTVTREQIQAMAHYLTGIRP